jgi:transposase-like protein
MFPEFKSIFDLLKVFPDEQSCINHLVRLRWDGNSVSPFDETSKVYKCAGNKYKCKNTGKYFNVRTNTIFDNTKIPLQKWFLALYVFSSHKKGISSHQLAKDITVTQKSAWFLLHRLRYAFVHPNFKNTLTNIVEIDETFVSGESKSKHSNKKTKNERGGTLHEKQPVLGMRERDGNVIAVVIPNRNKETILPIIQETVENDSIIMTDEYTAYKDLKHDYTHNTVNH